VASFWENGHFLISIIGDFWSTAQKLNFCSIITSCLFIVANMQQLFNALAIKTCILLHVVCTGSELLIKLMVVAFSEAAEYWISSVHSVKK